MSRRQELLEATKQVEKERISNKIESEVSRSFTPNERVAISDFCELVNQAPAWEEISRLVKWGLQLLVVAIIMCIFRLGWLAGPVFLVAFFCLGSGLYQLRQFQLASLQIEELIGGLPAFWLPLLRRFRQIVIDAGGQWEDGLIPSKFLSR